MTAIFGLLGLTIGSFLNVCIDRLPAKKSLAYPASHCDACQHPLAIRDNIPVVSYLWLKGKCRYCGATIPVRIILVEFSTGVLLALLFRHYGLTWQLPLYAFYICLLLVIAVIDLDTQLILNILVYPAAAMALIIDIFQPQIGLVYGLIGGAAGFVILLIPALISRRGIGWGDVKLAGLIGIMTGFPRVFVAILAGIIMGGFIAVLLLLVKKKSRKDAIPFGPFLALGSLLALLRGYETINWYLSLFK